MVATENRTLHACRNLRRRYENDSNADKSTFGANAFLPPRLRGEGRGRGCVRRSARVSLQRKFFRSEYVRVFANKLKQLAVRVQNVCWEIRQRCFERRSFGAMRFAYCCPTDTRLTRVTGTRRTRVRRLRGGISVTSIDELLRQHDSIRCYGTYVAPLGHNRYKDVQVAFFVSLRSTVEQSAETSPARPLDEFHLEIVNLVDETFRRELSANGIDSKDLKIFDVSAQSMSEEWIVPLAVERAVIIAVKKLIQDVSVGNADSP